MAETPDIPTESIGAKPHGDDSTPIQPGLKANPLSTAPYVEAIGNWICPQCENRFTQKCHLARHSTVHSNVFHPCDQCETKFKFKWGLTAHRRLKHSAIPFTKYRCDECQQLFLTRSDLVQHRFQHSNEPNYPCGDCPMIFKTPTERSGHIRRKHKEAD